MIVDQAIYRQGRRLVCQDLSTELDRLRDEGNGFLWIGLKDPTDAEFALVNDELRLQVRQGRPFVSLEPQSSGGYLVRTAVPLRSGIAGNTQPMPATT